MLSKIQFNPKFMLTKDYLLPKKEFKKEEKLPFLKTAINKLENQLGHDLFVDDENNALTIPKSSPFLKQNK